MPAFTATSVLNQVFLLIEKEDLKAASVYAEWLRRNHQEDAYLLASAALLEAGWDG